MISLAKWLHLNSICRPPPHTSHIGQVAEKTEEGNFATKPCRLPQLPHILLAFAGLPRIFTQATIFPPRTQFHVLKNVPPDLQRTQFTLGVRQGELHEC